jgi:hypothetical protein
VYLEYVKRSEKRIKLIKDRRCLCLLTSGSVWRCVRWVARGRRASRNYIQAKGIVVGCWVHYVWSKNNTLPLPNYKLTDYHRGTGWGHRWICPPPLAPVQPTPTLPAPQYDKLTSTNLPFFPPSTILLFIYFTLHRELLNEINLNFEHPYYIYIVRCIVKDNARNYENFLMSDQGTIEILPSRINKKYCKLQVQHKFTY